MEISPGVIDEETEQELKDNLTEEEFSIITNNTDTVKFKFKLIEVFSE